MARGDGSSVARYRYKVQLRVAARLKPGFLSAGEMSSRIGLSSVVHEQSNRDWIEYVVGGKSMLQNE
jgi:hypothetical protein